MRRVATGLAAAALLALSWTTGQAAPPPLSSYGALPAIENIAISASGEKLAFVTVTGEKRALVIQEVTGQPLGVMGVGDTKIRDVLWAGDEHVVIVTSRTTSAPEFGVQEGEWLAAQSYSLKKKRFINVTSQVPNSWGLLSYAPELRQMNGKWYAFVANYSLVRPIIVLHRVSLEDGATGLVETMPSGDGESWLIDSAGVPQARSRYNTVRGYWSLGVRQGAIWPDVYQVDASIDPPSLIGFGRDGRSVLIQEGVAEGGDYVEVTPETGKLQPAIPDDHLHNGVLLDPDQRLIGATYFDDGDRYVFFDPADQAAWNSVLRAFKGQRVDLSTWSADRKKVVVHVQGAKNSGVYYLVDLGAKRADILGETYPGVTAEDVAEIKPYSYKAADGLDIPGFLTLPPGREAKNLPLVVLAHGGPQGHDGPGFDYWAQAIASRGYAVLQANFRGSSGYGQDYVAAGYGEWGRKMQTDLSDGVRALAAQGVIDPKKVCIVGASYGGYAAMAGVTVQQDVYRCAVAVAGISDLRDMLKWEAQQGGKKTEAMRYWRRFMGAKTDNDPALDAVSPLRNVARAGAPILLIHGKDDTVVPFQQSTRLAEALREAGKPVQMVTLKAEDHWLSRGATRQQMLEETVGFLLRENPPQ
jgi:dipeptidyl aminopeptidase/acylaminoacyl peptidase